MGVTRTYVKLELSQPAYDEISTKLRTSGYDHDFVTLTGSDAIYMHGIAVTRCSDIVEKANRRTENSPAVVAKLLRAIAAGSDAKVTQHDVILNAAAKMLDTLA